MTAGTALTVGGTTGGVTLNVDMTKVMTTVIAGTDLTGGGTGGVQTLNLDTTKVPQLSTANTFSGSQTISGNLIATMVGTSGGSPNVASVAIQNTAGGGLRLREGAGTGASYLASTGSLRLITSDTGTQSNPSSAAMTIDTSGRVGIGAGLTPTFPLHVSGEIRGEGGLSLSSSGPFNVDGPGVPGGRLTILSNGKVGINNPNPQSILDVVGNIDASGTLIGSGLNVNGSALIGGGLTLIGGVSMTAGATIGAGLTVTGDSSVGGTSTVTGSVNVGGAVNANIVNAATLSVNGDRSMQRIHICTLPDFFPAISFWARRQPTLFRVKT